MKNIDKLQMFYVSAYVPVKVCSWYNFTVQMNVTKNKYDVSILTDQRWIIRGNTQHTVNLPKNWTISLSGWFGSKGYYSNMEISPMGGIDGTISKRMFNNKLVASFNWWNIQGFRYVDLTVKAQDYLLKESI